MEYTIRPARLTDALGIHALRRMPGVFENILGLPSESLRSNEDFLRQADANAHYFVAITTDDTGVEQVIGMAGLNVCANPRQRHSGAIGMMVHTDYQGQGIGRKLLETMLEVADNWLMLVRLELQVFVGNERAIRLYEACGFITEGLNRKSAIRHGAYADMLMMARIKGDS